MEHILYRVYVQSLRAKLELSRITAASLMELFIDRLRIKFLKARIEVSRLSCTSLADECEKASTGAEKTEILSRYDEALKRTHMMQLTLEQLERKERDQ